MMSSAAPGGCTMRPRDGRAPAAARAALLSLLLIVLTHPASGGGSSPADAAARKLGFKKAGKVVAKPAAPAKGGDKYGYKPTLNTGGGWEQCRPAALPSPRKALRATPRSKGRPNVIVILTDDQTPNIDRFLQTGLEFDNFYVAPMCSQTRAQLLTGRDYPKTGALLVNGGYDLLHRGEATIAELLKKSGYKTAHFGKWHNGFSLGYEPWSVGFDESWLPTAHIHVDNLMRHNGVYKQTWGLMEEVLMDKIITYLKDHKNNPDKPFFLYYPTHLMHAGFMRPGEGPRWQRPAPRQYLDLYQGVQSDTQQAFAADTYLDHVLGRLFDHLHASGLMDNTYVFLTGDNGAELFGSEKFGEGRKLRVPSRMVANKRSAYEGGIRQFLGVQGPGVARGELESTLLGVTDLLPTILELTGARGPSLPLDGRSFAALLPGGASGAAGAASSLDSRFIVAMDPTCAFDPDFVPALGADRQLIKQQPLLSYGSGTPSGGGFERCIGVRHGPYKWVGQAPGKLYKFHSGSHVELPCNEVGGPEKDATLPRLRAAAAAWWASVLESPHGVAKPTFVLGLDDWRVSNVLGAGAIERTAGRIRLEPGGLAGYVRPGDAAHYRLRVLRPGTYTIEIVYASNTGATFDLSIGPYAAVKGGSAPRTRFHLPQQGQLGTKWVGSINVPRAQDAELRLALVGSDSYGAGVFKALDVIRLTRQDGGGGGAQRRPALNGRASAKEAAVLPASAPVFLSAIANAQNNTQESVYDPCEVEGVPRERDLCPDGL